MRAITSMGGSKDMYLAPELLLTLARLKLALGKESEGRQLLVRATDVVEAMLTHTSQLTTRDALLTTMSNLYTARFALAAQHNNVTEAFNVIEQIRGRVISELLMSGPQISDLDNLNATIEDKIAALKLRIVKASSDEQRRALLDDLFYTEQARWISNVPKQGAVRARLLLRPPAIALQQVQNVLRPDELLLEYVLDGPRSYCLRIDRSSARLIELPARQEIDSETSSLLDEISKGKKVDNRESSCIGP
jgi:hypothetical protein